MSCISSVGHQQIRRISLDSEASTTERSFRLFNPEFGNELVGRLNEFRKAGILTDLVIVVEDEEIACHRVVLASSSSYFKAMFTSSLAESKLCRVQLQHVSAKIVQLLVDYAYTGSLEITEDNAQDLLAAANHFNYGSVLDASAEFLRKQLDAANCLGVEQFARLHGCESLQLAAHDFALENFTAVIDGDEFVRLEVADVLAYLGSDGIDVQTEETVYFAAMQWLHFDPERRAAHVADLLQQVRLGTIESEFLEKVVAVERAVMSNATCCQLLADVRRLAARDGERPDSHSRRRSLQRISTVPRPSTMARQVMVLIGGLNTDILQTVDMCDPVKMKWASLPSLHCSVLWHATAVVGNDVYVTGGVVNQCVVDTVHCFRASSRSWHQVASLLGPRARHSAVAQNGRLYVFGGVRVEGDTRAVEAIEAYDATADRWTVVGEATCARVLSQLVAYRDRAILEVGGLVANGKVKNVENYACLDTGQVQSSGEQFVLSEAVGPGKFLAHDGLLYIIWEDTKMFISFDPVKRIFRRLPDLHYAHVNSGAAVVGGKIYVTGGIVDSRPSRLVECYDPDSQQWTLQKSLPQARACHSCVTVQL